MEYYQYLKYIAFSNMKKMYHQNDHYHQPIKKNMDISGIWYVKSNQDVLSIQIAIDDTNIKISDDPTLYTYKRINDYFIFDNNIYQIIMDDNEIDHSNEMIVYDLYKLKKYVLSRHE
jgi:hypothetical protein